MFIDIIRQLHFIPQILTLFVLFVFSYLFIRDNKEKTISIALELIRKEKWMASFLLYVAFLLSCTVLARTYSLPEKDIIGKILLIYERKVNIGAIENILIFVPYTYLFLQAFKIEEKTTWKCFQLSAITTVIIELCQLLFVMGWFQVADLIHNIIGGMIGCGVWKLQKTLFYHSLKQGKSKSEE